MGTTILSDISREFKIKELPEARSQNAENIKKKPDKYKTTFQKGELVCTIGL